MCPPHRAYITPSCEVLRLQSEGTLCASVDAQNETFDNDLNFNWEA